MLIARNSKRKISAALIAASLLLGFVPVSAQTVTTPSSTAAVESPNAFAALESRIRAKLASPEVRRGSIGIKAVSLSTGKVVFEENAEKYFMPASNMKNFTVATAIEKLSPDYRYVTAAFASAKPDADGTLKGPLRIAGRGDVSISYTFNGDDRYKGIDKLVDAIAAAGVKKIDGDIIGDASYFKGSPLPTGWEWDDLQFYYGAEVSALPVNDNVVGLSVAHGPVGAPCSVRMNPQALVMRVINKCLTTAAGTPRTLRIHKPLDQNVIEVTGELPAGTDAYSGFVSVSRPAEMFAVLLRDRLFQKNIQVTGRAYGIHDKSFLPTDSTVEIARVESPPMALIAANTMKPSQNMYTETLLWTLGEEVGRKSALPDDTRSLNADSSELGRKVVKDFLTGIGIPEDAVLQADGSGLSRHNLVTPASVVRLYTYMAKESKYSRAWRDSLTIGGVDGTLRNRFKGTRGQANVRGKTGTINQVSALSGYLTTAAGEELAFSVLVNGVADGRTRVALIDEIVMMLVNLDASTVATEQAKPMVVK
ncbi:MAG: D-alanyl-D-alanine carboxypeptidase/D-alanyl-D-alanine-endopeptidase [Pyrinomonadaceae bacterium]|nr:D-alanyl-D-alanine carboxypeptidase/D-alanyl-D-alanine-endopeptidase [Pyrinomonadaceae bacterium]